MGVHRRNRKKTVSGRIERFLDLLAVLKTVPSRENGLSKSRERRHSRQNAPVEHFE